MIECFCKQTNYKNVVKFKLFKDSGDEKLLPKIHNDFAATADLYVGEDTPIKKKNQITLIPTGVIIDQMHPGYGLMITPKRSLDIGIVEMGIIDADYNKEIFIKFINLSNKRILKKFEGIAQITPFKRYGMSIEKVTSKSIKSKKNTRNKKIKYENNIENDINGNSENNIDENDISENSIDENNIDKNNIIDENDISENSEEKNNDDDDKIHPEAIYTSRLLEFDNLLEPVNLKENETGKIIDENNHKNNNNNRINNNTYDENDNINKNILKRKLSQDYINEYIEF